MRLSDGKNHYSVTLATGDVCDSDTAQAINQDVQQKIGVCDGPTDGLLRRKCGAGLASAWRCSKLIGTYEPNISSPKEIIPLLGNANYRDAIPRFREETWFAGDPQDYSEQYCSPRSPFVNRGIIVLTDTVRGTRAELKEGTVVMLDHVSWSVDDKSLRDVFRLRIAQGGPHFAFRSSIGLNPIGSKKIYDCDIEEIFAEGRYAPEIEKIFAEGIYTYLSSDAEAVAQSNALIKAAGDSAREHFKRADDAWTAYRGLRWALRGAGGGKKKKSKTGKSK